MRRGDRAPRESSESGEQTRSLRAVPDAWSSAGPAVGAPLRPVGPHVR